MTLNHWHSDSRLAKFVRRHGRHTPRMAGWAVLRTLYSQEFIRRLVRPLVPPRRPEKWLFVVGCYNSGTTVTQRLLAAHPQIRTLPWEGALITSVLPNPEDLGWTRMWLECPDHMRMPDRDDPRIVDQLLRDWAPWWGSGGTVFLEKSISNGTRIPWLDRNLGPAWFVHIVRDGYCVAEGIRRKARPRQPVARDFGATYPLEMTARQWVAANQMILRDARGLAHYHFLRYEDLVRDPVQEIRRIWEFVGLAPVPIEIGPDTLSITGTTIPFSRTMNRASRSQLSPAECQLITPIIAEEQTRLGYALMGTTDGT